MQTSDTFSSKHAYRSINCDFYDVLLAKATRKEVCTFVIELSPCNILRIKGKIVDVYTKAGEEFLKLECGKVFRLDSLKQLDGLLAS